MDVTKGLVVVPSLDRPAHLREFFNCYRATESVIPGIVMIDGSDWRARSAEYSDIELPERWKILVGYGVTMGAKINEHWDLIEAADFCIILNDDHRVKTKNWDTKIAIQLTGKNIVSTNDGWRSPATLAGAISYSGDVLRTIGWMFPPGVQHLYHDDVWQKLGSGADCLSCDMSILVEHDHVFKNGKEDETHKKVYSPERWTKDGAAYERWVKEDFEKDLEKLRRLQK